MVIWNGKSLKYSQDSSKLLVNKEPRSLRNEVETKKKLCKQNRFEGGIGWLLSKEIAVLPRKLKDWPILRL